LYKPALNTAFLGKKVIHLPTCQSTNDLAAVMVAEGNLGVGEVLIADAQTHGRGQRGNTWEATPGQNLTFSLVLGPVFLALDQQFYLNVVVALAVADTAQQATGLLVEVKWPNDVYCQGQKIGGILIENTLTGRQIKTSIVGIGLNVNQSHFAWPQAASLRTLTGQTHVLPELLERMLEHLEHHYAKLQAGQISSLRADYLDRLYARGQWRPFTDLRLGQGTPFVGQVVTVAEDGRLVVQYQEGESELFYFKEIAFG
jgi:BirA family transcriptional regulator, biotin operon repressor / biotin---[acetyl-CoA-carboxylase] ligase